MRTILISFLLCLQLGVAAQNQYIMPLIEHASKFNHVLPQETVYLHFDNTGYFRGEKIWYKAYVVSSDGDSLSRKSGVLYVELVDPLGTVVDTQILKLTDGQGHGDFTILPHLSAGFYEVRAYTRYMLNWNPAGIFSRVLPIFEQPTEAGNYSDKVLNQPTRAMLRASKRGGKGHEAKGEKRVNVDVYPEGGHLVIGRQGRVAFDVYDREGLQVKARCALMHGKDTLLVTSTDSMGRGMVELTPDNEEHRLVVWADGHRGETTLPAAISSGCALRVEAGRERTDITVQPTTDMAGMKLGVVTSHHGQMEVCDSFVVANEAYTASISNTALADGVNTVTVFTSSGVILAERMFFVYPRRAVSPISIWIEGRALSPYDSVTVVCRTERPRSTFSLAVRDADTQVQGTSTDAATNLLLASDLKGYVANARYYLEADDDAHRRATDLLMMVQGWRKYDFEMMNGMDRLQLKHPAEKGLMLMGQLHPRKKSDRVDNVDLGIVLLKKEGVLKGTTTTNEKGYYTFAVPDCWGTWNMIMRTSIDDKNKNYYIGVDRRFSPNVKAYSPYEQMEVPADKPRIHLAEGVTAIPRKWRDSHLLKEVEVKGKRHQPGGWKNESFGAWKALLTYNCLLAADHYADMGQPSPTLYDWLREQNPLFAGNDNISGESSFRNARYNFHDDGPSYDNKGILWILDNKFMFATSMPTRMVKTPKHPEHESMQPEVFPTSVEGVKSVYISTSRSNLRKEFGLDDGAYVGVYIYTYNPQYNSYKGMRRTYFDGFNIPTTFQHNNYHTMPPVADFRRTLYWNPDVTTDASGNAKVGFFNNSTCRQMVISAEGVAEDGTVLLY